MKSGWIAAGLLLTFLAGSLAPHLVLDGQPELPESPSTDAMTWTAPIAEPREAEPSTGQEETAEPAKKVPYDLILSCPGAPGARCPVRAIDRDDAMGAPAIAVDPDDASNMIIASLHGRTTTGDEGPEPRSRQNQVYTTFTSRNSGASWTDNPFFAPDDLPDESRGEHPGITLDPYGRVYIGSLYSVPRNVDSNGNPAAPWDYVIAAQKFSGLRDIDSNQNGEYNLDYIPSLYRGSRIGQTWFLHNPITDNMTIVWNEQVTEHSEGVDGPPVSSIGVAWTTADVLEKYHGQGRDRAIQPCSTSTNPVMSEGWLYIGCKVADEGPLRWDPSAEPGDIAIFRMDPDGGEPQYLGLAPFSGGEPKMGVRSDGRMAIMTTELFEGNGTPIIRLEGAYGKYDPETETVLWGPVHAYGPQMQILYANTPYVEVNIQDMIYREYSGVIHLIFKRVVDWSELDPLLAYRPVYYKSIIAIDEEYGVLMELDLGIGKMQDRLQDAILFNSPVEAFNDVADDFLELPPGQFEYNGRPLGETYQREFYAVGNFGTVDFAEVIEITDLRGPAFPSLPNPPPPPTPAPASASSLALGLSGAITASALTAGTAATMKRKSATGAGRKKRN